MKEFGIEVARCGVLWRSASVPSPTFFYNCNASGLVNVRERPEILMGRDSWRRCCGGGIFALRRKCGEERVPGDTKERGGATNGEPSGDWVGEVDLGRWMIGLRTLPFLSSSPPLLN